MKKSRFNALLYLFLGMCSALSCTSALSSPSSDYQEELPDDLPKSHLLEAIVLANPYLINIFTAKMDELTQKQPKAKKNLRIMKQRIQIRYQTIPSRRIREILELVGINLSVQRDQALTEIIKKMGLESFIGTYSYKIKLATSSLDGGCVRVDTEVSPSPVMVIQAPVGNQKVKIVEVQETASEIWMPFDVACRNAKTIVTQQQTEVVKNHIKERDLDPKDIFQENRREKLHKAGIPVEYDEALENPYHVRLNQHNKIEVLYSNIRQEKGESPNAYVPVQIRGKKKGKSKQLSYLSFYDGIAEKKVTLKLVSFIIYDRGRQSYNIFTRIGNSYYAYVWNRDTHNWEVKKVSKEKFYEKSESSQVYIYYYKKYTDDPQAAKAAAEQENKPLYHWAITITSLGFNAFLVILILAKMDMLGKYKKWFPL